MIWKANFPEDTPDTVKTPINLCNHTYWNLSGDFKDATVGDHGLVLNCDKVLDTEPATQAPNGDLLPVQDTLFDFRPEVMLDEEGKEVEKPPRLVGSDERLKGAIKVGEKIGLDHAFVINKPLED